jgi:hypothetical protein
MGWFPCQIRWAANIPTEHSEIFERYGVEIVALTLAGAGGSDSIYPGAPELQKIVTDARARLERQASGKPPKQDADMDQSARAWLIENHDIDDCKKTWSLTMEVAITILVAAELIFSILKFFHVHSALHNG